jgi:hypothetical protein
MSATQGSTPGRQGAPDRVLPITRALSIVIIPFLLVAFVLLYFWPSADDTARLFAWRITPGFTSMLLAAVYLGGAYYFLRVFFEREWHRVAGGFVAVGSFATLMGVATALHWDKFIHTNVAFWVWAALYFTTPFLVFVVWLVNRQVVAPADLEDLLLADGTAIAIGVFGSVAVGTCAFLFLLPKVAITVWPWPLTELTARVTGAIFALGVAGLGAFFERRWSSARILFQVEGCMLLLIAIAVIRSLGDFYPARPVTWVFAVGLVVLAVGSVVVYVRMEGRARVQVGR